MEASFRLGVRLSKSTRARTASCGTLLLLLAGAIFVAISSHAAERVDLSRELSLSVFQNLKLHSVLLSFRQAELLLIVLTFGVEHRKIVVEAIFVTYQRHSDLRLDFLTSHVNVVSLEDLILFVDQVENLHKKGGIRRLISDESRKQLLQPVDGFTF